MLEAMTPEQFDERLAHWELAEWGESRKETAMVVAALHNAAVLVLGALCQFAPKEEMFRDESDFMPDSETKHKKRKMLSAREAEAIAKARYGGK